MKLSTKPDGFKYCSYLLIYVDDCLTIEHAPDEVIKQLMEKYKLKNNSYGQPEHYLGANIGEYYLSDGNKYWPMPVHDYLKQACKTVKEMTVKEGRCWIKKRKNLMVESYHPEIDISTWCGDELGSHYMQLIRILCWGVELSWIDIITEVPMLSS